VLAGAQIEGARAIDLAPTLAHALGISGPRDADGRVLREVFEAAEPEAWTNASS
jgi:arylsulfatase A-like enzyme